MFIFQFKLSPGAILVMVTRWHENIFKDHFSDLFQWLNLKWPTIHLSVDLTLSDSANDMYMFIPYILIY